MTRQSRNLIDLVRDAIDFPSLVEETTGPLSLQPDGRPAMALCPWHDDRKTPSLAVYGDHAHCYGCGWHGDAFDWIAKRDGLTFPQALAELQRRAGISLPPMTPAEEQATLAQSSYEEGLRQAARFFAGQLRKVPAARAYARSRAWPDELVTSEGVGWADGGVLPDLGDARAQQVAEDLNNWARQVGGALVYAHRSGSRVVYLSARSIEGKHHHNPPADLAGPKEPYANCRFSPRVSQVVLVEGQACAVSLAAWDVPGLALAGSSLTDRLAGRLRQMAERGVILYVVPDADGRTDLDALARAAGPLLGVVRLPEGCHDVNAWAQQGGTAEQFRELLDQAVAWLDLQIEAAAAAQGIGRDRATEALFTELQRLAPVALARYRERVVKALGLKGPDFTRLLGAARAAAARPSPVEVLEGDHPVISPAQDFLDGLAVVTIPLLARDGDEVGYRPYLVTSGREIVALEGGRLVEIGGRSVVLRDVPAALGSGSRWSWADVQAYLAGDSPSPVEAYLETERLLDKYIDFRDEGTSDALAVWVMGTYVFTLFEAYPYVVLQGPKGSGKTKVLDLAARLAFNARVSSSMSPASLFRVVEATRGTLGIDEAERLADPRDPIAGDLRLLLNAGYKRGAPAIRCEGEDHKVTEFEVYGPKILASIRGVEDILETRCIRITMLRTTGPKGNLVVSESGEEWARARHGLYCFALQHYPGVRDLYLQGAGAEGLNNRQAELWRPLLAIASYLDTQGATGLRELMQGYARLKSEQAEEAGLDDWRAAMLLALHKLVVIEGRASVAPKEVSEAMQALIEEGSQVGAQWVGYRLKEFGFERTHGHRRVYLVSAQRVLDVMERYGVEIPRAGDEN